MAEYPNYRATELLCSCLLITPKLVSVIYIFLIFCLPRLNHKRIERILLIVYCYSYIFRYSFTRYHIYCY
jgi:hypothetical protein